MKTTRGFHDPGFQVCVSSASQVAGVHQRRGVNPGPRHRRELGDFRAGQRRSPAFADTVATDTKSSTFSLRAKTRATITGNFPTRNTASCARTAETCLPMSPRSNSRSRDRARSRNAAQLRVSDLGKFFSMMGVKPFRGRFYNAEECGPNANLPVVVASYGFWKRMGARNDFVGSTLAGERAALHGHRHHAGWIQRRECAGRAGYLGAARNALAARLGLRRFRNACTT